MSISGKSTRREFLVKTSSATLVATVPFCGGAVPDVSELDGTSGQNPDSSEDFFKAGSQRTFQGDRTTQIAFPLGGIGAGCMCLNGYGGLQDFSIFNHPTLTALPGDSYSRPF